MLDHSLKQSVRENRKFGGHSIAAITHRLKLKTMTKTQYITAHHSEWLSDNWIVCPVKRQVASFRSWGLSFGEWYQLI